MESLPTDPVSNEPPSSYPVRTWPAPQPGTFSIDDFKFASGQVLPKLHLSYQTLGTLRVSPDGTSSNAVLIMHGTGGSSAQFLNANFAGELFNPGQLLDARDYFIVLRDGIGHGESSKPSNTSSSALDTNSSSFPNYGYGDMVHADHALLTRHLGIPHLRLVMGTSMGGMQTFLWGTLYPSFMDALMPLASLPVQISGRNRMWRKMIIDSLRSDQPSGCGISETAETKPKAGLAAALRILTMMSSSPLQYQSLCPTRDMADEWLEERIEAGVASTDSNDLLYAIESSSDYNPQPDLHKIQVPLIAVNTADDQINPPELKLLEREVGNIKKGLGKPVVLPITEQTRGHGSHTIAALWKDYLGELLVKTAKGGDKRESNAHIASLDIVLDF